MDSSVDSPIGIFDSGVGGLTVVKSVMKLLPNEHIIYFGDTARVPYGIKSTETIREYALQITDFLLRKQVKIIIVACNSVAASASKEIRKKCKNIPVVDVIEAGCKQATTRSAGPGQIGVIGTLATIGSGAYEKVLRGIDDDIRCFSRACPMLVPLAEEGWTDNPIALEILEKYLSDFREKELKSIILGCTHYPLFKKGIRKILGENINIIDSADAAAEMAKEILELEKKTGQKKPGEFDCFVTDKPQRFKSLAERFLGQKLSRVEIVNIKG